MTGQAINLNRAERPQRLLRNGAAAKQPACVAPAPARAHLRDGWWDCLERTSRAGIRVILPGLNLNPSLCAEPESESFCRAGILPSRNPSHAGMEGGREGGGGGHGKLGGGGVGGR